VLPAGYAAAVVAGTPLTSRDCGSQAARCPWCTRHAPVLGAGFLTSPRSLGRGRDRGSAQGDQQPGGLTRARLMLVATSVATNTGAPRGPDPGRRGTRVNVMASRCRPTTCRPKRHGLLGGRGLDAAARGLAVAVVRPLRPHMRTARWLLLPEHRNSPSAGGPAGPWSRRRPGVRRRPRARLHRPARRWQRPGSAASRWSTTATSCGRACAVGRPTPLHRCGTSVEGGSGPGAAVLTVGDGVAQAPAIAVRMGPRQRGAQHLPLHRAAAAVRSGRAVGLSTPAPRALPGTGGDRGRERPAAAARDARRAGRRHVAEPLRPRRGHRARRRRAGAGGRAARRGGAGPGHALRPVGRTTGWPCRTSSSTPCPPGALVATDVGSSPPSASHHLGTLYRPATSRA